ncbi:hypothetical protein [Sphingobacterium sp.]|uniref:hypothetical protein n=1 Tax=Sphingobacterium sp. TaxID=341027 RepID=UPI0028AD6C8A|nr:hypothetical protein [Sphingobacterium sp.]
MEPYANAIRNNSYDLGLSSHPFHPGSFHDLGPSFHPFHPGSNKKKPYPNG